MSQGIVEKGPVKPGAVVLDVVTSPIQAPVFIVGGAMHLQHKAEVRSRAEAVIADLEKNPELLLDPQSQARWNDNDINNQVAKWVVQKVESPDGFKEDLLFELLRHDTALTGYVGRSFRIPERASIELLDRLYDNYHAHCLVTDSFHPGHIKGLVQAYAQKSSVGPRGMFERDLWDDFIFLQPAKAKELRSAYSDESKSRPPEWWQELRQAWAREASGESADNRSARRSIDRAARDAGVLFKPDFWAELPAARSRWLVGNWMRTKLARNELLLSDDQFFEIFRADGVLPSEVAYLPFPADLGPNSKSALFKRIYEHNVSLIAADGSTPRSFYWTMERWCAHAIDKHSWDGAQCTALFLRRYPEQARELIRRCAGHPNRPSFVRDLERAAKR